MAKRNTRRQFRRPNSKKNRQFWSFAAFAAITVARAYLNQRPVIQEHSHAPEQAAFGKEPKRKPTGVDYERALQVHRGRDATSPFQIPWAGWKDIFWRTYQQIEEDRLLAIAGGVVFFGLLAVFPALAAFISLYGLFAEVGTISEHFSLAAGIVPAAMLDIFREQVVRIVLKGDATLGFAFVFGLCLALWSANAGMKAIIDALNVIYGEKEKRSLVKLTLVAFAFTVGTIVFMLFAVGAVIVLPIVLNVIGFGSIGETLIKTLRWPALLMVIVSGLACLYRYGPSRVEPRWQWLSVGSFLAAVVWLVSSILLSWYLEKFADYNATYGSLGAGIGMMMWMWVSAIAILFGAEVNAEVEHQTARDSTVGNDKPLGVRGAAMADTVGKSSSPAKPMAHPSQISVILGDLLSGWTDRVTKIKRKRSRSANLKKPPRS